jgi:hypothetical protein
MCIGRFNLHSAPDGAGKSGIPRAINILRLRSKNLDTIIPITIGCLMAVYFSSFQRQSHL